MAKKLRANCKWLPEIDEFLRRMSPCPEHDFNTCREVVDAIEDWFGVRFTVTALRNHCYAKGIRLGFCGTRIQGKRVHTHKPVGAFQERKGYLRIKVAEPNKWELYHHLIWEQAHPGESLDGRSVMFMDGNNRNFAPENLEAVTQGEMALMSELGCVKDCTPEERLNYLLRVRLKMRGTELLGREKAVSLRRKAYYERLKADPEKMARKREQNRLSARKIREDPIRYARQLECNRVRRRKK